MTGLWQQTKRKAREPIRARLSLVRYGHDGRPYKKRTTLTKSRKGRYNTYKGKKQYLKY